MGNKLWTKDKHTKIIELRERITKARNWYTYQADPLQAEAAAADMLLPASFNRDLSGLKSWSASVILKNVLTETGEKATKDEDMKYLEFKINIDVPIKTILADIELTIKNFQVLKKNRKKLYLNLDRIEKDMDIFELHYYEGKNIEEIAQKIIPNNKDAAREVKRRLSRIKKIIEGGL